jgi:DNA-binding response OmpR family regulator
LKRKPLGQLLVQRSVLAPAKLREVLELQRSSGNRLATECYNRRFASEEDLLAALSSQVGVPGIHLAQLVLPLVVLDHVPEQTALKQQMLPVRVDGDRLFLAMADPLDSGLIAEVAFLSSHQVLACVALAGPLRHVISESYAAKKRGELEYRGEHALGDPQQEPAGLVYPRELTRVPSDLLRPTSKSGQHPIVGQPPAAASGAGDIVIAVDDGVAGDLVIPFEVADDEWPSAEEVVGDPAEGELGIIMLPPLQLAPATPTPATPQPVATTSPATSSPQPATPTPATPQPVATPPATSSPTAQQPASSPTGPLPAVTPAPLPTGRLPTPASPPPSHAAPEAAPVAASPPRTAEAAPPTGKVTIQVLVVDDDPELRRLVSRVLRGKGMQVQEASRGLEALNRIKVSPPDLILLDAMLPEIHGFDICRKIKSSERYGHIPVIMISSIYRGWRIARDLQESYGVSAFMEKPFTIDMLWSTVERVLLSRSRTHSGSRQPVAEAEERYREALQRFKADDLDGAIESCREGLRHDPLSAKLHYRLGIFFLKKPAMVYQAVQEFEEAVALDPELFSALRTLGTLYQRKGFKNKAIDMWERALRCAPDDQARETIRSHLKTLF